MELEAAGVAGRCSCTVLRGGGYLDRRGVAEELLFRTGSHMPLFLSYRKPWLILETTPIVSILLTLSCFLYP